MRVFLYFYLNRKNVTVGEVKGTDRKKWEGVSGKTTTRRGEQRDEVTDLSSKISHSFARIQLFSNFSSPFPQTEKKKCEKDILLDNR